MAGTLLAVSLLSYEYDADGDLVGVTDREGNKTRFDYYANHYLKEIVDALGRVGVRNEYDEAGRLNKTLNATGNSVTINYDPENSLQTVLDALGNPTTYEYDLRGNVVTEIDAMGGITRRVYDNDNNLLSETDPLGRTNTYTYDTRGNLLSTINPLGNITLSSYDNKDRLISIIDPLGNTTRSIYDSRGNLTNILPYAQVVEEYNSEGIIVSYVYGHDLISQQQGSQRYFSHVDALGSMRVLTDENGMVSARYVYDAFGRIVEQVGFNDNKYLFAGEQRDLSLGLDYLRARYMNPELGRFVSRDTFVGDVNNPVTLHRYLYGNANPVMFIDPSGLQSLSEIIATDKMRSILTSMMDKANHLLNFLDKVDNTFSVIDAVIQAFQLAQNPSSLLPSQYITQMNLLAPQLAKLNMQDAILSLKANTGRIITGVLFIKLAHTQELGKLKGYLKDPKAEFVFLPPSPYDPSKLKLKLPLNIRIGTVYKKPLVIRTNKFSRRLFGISMYRRTNQDNFFDFFRIDYGSYAHAQDMGKNYDVWEDNKFHYHVPT